MQMCVIFLKILSSLLLSSPWHVHLQIICVIWETREKFTYCLFLSAFPVTGVLRSGTSLKAPGIACTLMLRILYYDMNRYTTGGSRFKRVCYVPFYWEWSLHSGHYLPLCTLALPVWAYLLLVDSRHYGATKFHYECTLSSFYVDLCLRRFSGRLRASVLQCSEWILGTRT